LSRDAPALLLAARSLNTAALLFTSCEGPRGEVKPLWNDERPGGSARGASGVMVRGIT
jgi:hypothetical protein